MLFFQLMFKKCLPYINIKVYEKEVHRYENDLSAQKETEIQSSWIQKKNEYSGRKKSNRSKTCKRKKEIISIGRKYVAFFSPCK